MFSSISNNIKIAVAAAFGFLLLLFKLKSAQLESTKKDLKAQKIQTKQAEKVADVKSTVSKVSAETEEVAKDEVNEAVKTAKRKRGHFTS